ncbi:protein kinase-like protein [Leishmania infantum JPCM5]|uniref:Protein kinase-like protein n=2 Tax=Leishmania infantum TaxID=5671 RepID=A4I2Y6_LEIIN|nr:protein kinase-like protein [Leishmania infantum JPCM5]CAC9500201.1 protein_kinase-like_protein [Leishmania infantum]CAM69138.1 protein kinase-like protein [Leishmania infantum JPCM5]SUZ43076.1 protein_kinase-like_protein [Leishmania infantum]|eukprot:XP_001466419.1 protein kinase-like protein [Leishmania infantum JPCM5]
MTSRGEHIRLDKGALVKNHYEVVTSIGAGNFSKVYRVIDLQLPVKDQRRNPLAMKVIKKEYSSDAKYEKQMLIVLHEHDKSRSARVSKMYECFVWQECPVFIMPLHGPCLRSRRLGVNRGVVTYEKLLEFSYDLLETMAFVHFQCHMVHTDLKPENILIADRNVADNSMGDEWVVCDFGSASLWRMDKLDSDLISTRPYRAPEVLLGNKWHYAADMWSIGCILYEVAVGHRLFESRDDLTHLHMMDRRIGRLPEAFAKHSKYSSKYFNSRGDFLSTPDAIRFSKCRLTPIREMFKEDREFLHLLKGLLTYNPDERMTAPEALALPIFDRVRVARKERQRRADAAAEECRQCHHSPGAVVPGDGKGLRLTGHIDHNTLEHIIADAKNGCTSHRRHHHQNHTKDETSGNNMADSRLEAATNAETTPAPGPAAASPAVGSSPQLDRQASAGTPRDTAAMTTTATTSAASATAEDTNSFAAPNVSAPSATSLGKKRVSKAAKVRGRAASVPVVQGCSSHHSGSPLSRVAVVTKEVPHQRPCVNSHHSTSTRSSALVPQLALHRFKTSTLASDHDAAPLPSKSGQRGSGRSGGRLSGRSVSPGSKNRRSTPHKDTSCGSQHGCGSSAAGDGGTQLNASSPLKSPHQRLQLRSGAAKRPNRTPSRSSATPYRLLETLSPAITRSPRMLLKASSAAGPSLGHSICISDIIATPPKQAFRAGALRSSSAAGRSPRNPATALGSRSHNSVTKKGEAGMVTTSPLGPSVAAPKALPLPAAATGTKTPRQQSLSPDAPLGSQSPLQRGVTAVCKDMQTKSLVVRGSPDVDDKFVDVGDATKGRSQKATSDDAGDEGDHGLKQVGSPLATSLAVMGDDNPDKVGDGNDDDDDSSLASPNAQLRDSVASPTSENCLGSLYNSDGSPRATDYRSPARCRPPVETSTGDTSGVSSPVMMSRSNARLSISSSEWRGVEVAPGVTLATATVKRGQRSFAAALATPLPPSQHNPRASQLSEVFYSPRELSPSAPSPSSLTGPRSTTAGSVASPPAVQTVESDENPHELFSTVPLSRAQLSRANSCSGSFGVTRNAAPASTVDSRSHMAPPSTCTTSAVGRSARELPTARTSVSATTVSTPAAPTHVCQASSSASQLAMVTASVGRLKSVPLPDVSDVRGSASPPPPSVTASRRAATKPGPAPVAATSAPAPACPSLEESTPVAPMNSMAMSRLPAALTRSRELSLSQDKGCLANPDTIASPPLLAAAAATPSTGAAGAAAVLHSSPHLPYQPTHGLVHPSGSNSHVLSETKAEEANCKTESQPPGLHMPWRSLLLPDHSPTCVSSPLPAIAAAAPATVTPTFTLPNKVHGAGERHEASTRNSGRIKVKSLSVQHPRTSPGPSPRPPPSSSSTNISFDVAAGAKCSGSTTANFTNAGTTSRLNSNFNNGGPKKLGTATSHYPAATSGSSMSTSFQAVSLSPRNATVPGAANTNSLRSSTNGVSAGPVRSPHSSASATTSPKISAMYQRTDSPRGIPPALMTTGLPISAIGGEVMPAVTVPLPAQPHHQLPSQAQQQPSTAVASTGAGPSKSSISIVPRHMRSGVASTRSSIHRQPLGTPVASTPRLKASDSTAASASLKTNAAAISLPKQACKTSSGTLNTVSSRGSTANAPVNTIGADALTRPTASQLKHRRDARTLRRIIVPRPSTSSLSQASRAASSSSPGAEDSGEQTRDTSDNSHILKQYDRDLSSCSSTTPIPLP